MRLLTVPLILLLVIAVAGCGEDDDEPATAPADAPALAELTVEVDRDGRGGTAARTAEVRCDSADESERCGAVADLRPESFEPVPEDVACTQQYGGPEVATVSGTLRGKAIDARFSRQNGCEISRWQDVAALLEAAL